MILLVMDFTGCCKWKQAENHLDFLICAGKLPNLKHGGRTVSAQKTTAKHSQITIEQQRLCWHGNIESVWQEQLQLNHPNEEFSALKAHFMCNVDETGVMANLGSIKVMGDLSKRKQEKNTDDCRDSIPIVRIGNAAGSSGPWIFLASGKRMTVNPLQNVHGSFLHLARE